MPATPKLNLTDFQKAVAVGTLLGDSSLSCPKTGRNFHLSCYHAIAQREWLLQKHAWLSPISRPIQWCTYIDKRDGKSRSGGRFHTASIPDFTELAKLFYRNGIKIISKEMLRLFTTPVALACLICDDGSWDGAGISIASKQFTKIENKRLANHFSEAFGLSVKPVFGQKYSHIRIAAISVKTARLLCFPFVPQCLRYKFGPPEYRTHLVGKILKICQWCKNEFLSYASLKMKFCSKPCANRGTPRRWTEGRKSPRKP